MWKVRFDARLEHYDVVASAAPDTADSAEAGQCSKGKQKTDQGPTSKDRPQTMQRGAQKKDGQDRARRRSHLGSAHSHLVMTLNVGGSREALINAMDTEARVLLIQEQKIASPGLPGIQGLAMGKGWHRVWDAAKANGNGRSGGTAVLVRRPGQIVRGGRIDRGTVAIVSWTRKS